LNQTFLFEFGTILVVAAALGVVARYFRQPLILAYLVAGILIGPFAFGLIKDNKIIENFAEIGIVFLLFLVGLELNPCKLIEIGNTALLAAFFQIIFSGAFYFLAAKLFGFPSISAVYLAVALTFSSTAIIVTLLSNRNDLDSLHGKILVGILLIQDFVAIFLLTVMSGLNSGDGGSIFYELGVKIIIRAIIIFALTYLVSKYVLPPIFRRIARSQELLFLSSLAWCFFLAVVALSLGFSSEIGAFLAGVSLATLPYSTHIAAKTRPLRDFFLMIFFIYLGTNLIFADLVKSIYPAIVFALLILVVNPAVVALVVSALGYRKRTSFLTGITLTQISEFSFLVVVLGSKLQILPKQALTLTSLIAVITVCISTYLISNGNRLYHFLRPHLAFLNFGNKKKDYLYNFPEQLEDHIILIGYHRIGRIIFETLKKNGEKVAIIDYDPRRIEELIEQGVNCTYGDAVDHDIVEQLNLKQAKMVISTIDKFEESELILKTYREINRRLKFIVTAGNAEEALELYEAGADLVIVPSLISGDYLAYLLKRLKNKEVELDELKKKEISTLESNGTEALVNKFTSKKL